jgi:hypothetical protein
MPEFLRFQSAIFTAYLRNRISAASSLFWLALLTGSWGSSVSTVSDYTLDDRCSIPEEENDFFSSLCVQTRSEAHPASYPMGTKGPFPSGKTRQGRHADHSPHLVPRLRMSRSYKSSPTYRLHGVQRDSLTLLNFFYY